MLVDGNEESQGSPRAPHGQRRRASISPCDVQRHASPKMPRAGPTRASDFASALRSCATLAPMPSFTCVLCRRARWPRSSCYSFSARRSSTIWAWGKRSTWRPNVRVFLFLKPIRQICLMYSCLRLVCVLGRACHIHRHSLCRAWPPLEHRLGDGRMDGRLAWLRHAWPKRHHPDRPSWRQRRAGGSAAVELAPRPLRLACHARGCHLYRAHAGLWLYSSARRPQPTPCGLWRCAG